MLNATARRWYWDALCASAFFLVALVVGKLATRTIGPALGILVFVINVGLGWLFARSASRGLMAARGKRG